MPANTTSSVSPMPSEKISAEAKLNAAYRVIKHSLSALEKEAKKEMKKHADTVACCFI